MPNFKTLTLSAHNSIAGESLKVPVKISAGGEFCGNIPVKYKDAFDQDKLMQLIDDESAVKLSGNRIFQSRGRDNGNG